MNETVLVTGGSSGVGRSLVEHLRDRYEVVTVARRIKRLEALFGEEESVHPYQMDLESIADIRQRIEKLNDEHGPILYLVNNAAVNLSRQIGEIDPGAMVTSLKVNTIAPLEVLQGLLPTMKDHDYGRVINVTSGAPLDIPEGAIPYSSSKAALNVATVTAARELSGENIKINLMSPGPTESEMAPDAPLSPSACHPTVDHLLSLPADGPTGRFFWLGNRVPLFPELGDVNWESGEASDAMQNVIDYE
jgi:NAD(P)-dependent dehydrogenase (short-subunit alcohol dehydrogenase family)